MLKTMSCIKNGIGLFANLNDATQITNVTFCGHIIFPATIGPVLEEFGLTLEDIFGSEELNVGGLAGNIYSNIETIGASFGIYFNVDINAMIGGLAGYSGDAKKCYSRSYICRNPAMEDENYSGINCDSCIGGLVGSCEIIDNCYSTSNITLIEDSSHGDCGCSVGGIVGVGSMVFSSYSVYYDLYTLYCPTGGIAGMASSVIRGCFTSPAYWNEDGNGVAWNSGNTNAYAVTYYSSVEDCIWLDDDGGTPADSSGGAQMSSEDFGGKTREALEVSWRWEEGSYSDSDNYSTVLSWDDFYAMIFDVYQYNDCSWSNDWTHRSYVNNAESSLFPQGYPALAWQNDFNDGSGTGGDSGSSNPGTGGTTYYKITYDGNGGVISPGNTSFDSVAKNGYFKTKRAGTFTKTGYRIVNWSTSPTEVAGSYVLPDTRYTFTDGKNITLYAIWTEGEAIEYKVELFVDVDGNDDYSVYTSAVKLALNRWTVEYYSYNSNNTVELKTDVYTSDNYTHDGAVQYINGLIKKSFAFSFTLNDGYYLVNYMKASSWSGTCTEVPKTELSSSKFTLVPTSSTEGCYLYIFLKKTKTSSNELKYDSTEKYFYFEDGYFPQSYVGDTLNTTLKNASSSSLSKYQTLNYLDSNGTEQAVDIYTYNSKKYAKVVKNSVIKWFSVEAIRWRVSEYGVSSTAYPSAWTKGSIITNFKVVSDRVLWVGAITAETTKESWKYTSSEMYNYVSNIYTKNGQTLTADKPQYVATSNETFYYYGEAGQQNKVKEERKSISNINVATESEIKEHLTSLKAKASDLVAFLLGLDEDSYCDYWTRELGGSLQNAKAVTNAGVLKSAWLSNFYGVRFSLCMSEGSRV